jgi:hypothetical protein
MGMNHTRKASDKCVKREPGKEVKENLLTGEAGKWPGILVSSFICN